MTNWVCWCHGLLGSFANLKVVIDVFFVCLNARVSVFSFLGLVFLLLPDSLVRVNLPIRITANEFVDLVYAVEQSLGKVLEQIAGVRVFGFGNGMTN